ncbi:MAG: hypothetical protein ACM30I_11050 [Gemmatimonas sp.]
MNDHFDGLDIANIDQFTNIPTSFERGSPQADDMTIHPGDLAFAGAGDDTVTISPVIGTGDVTGTDRAYVLAGQGDDTIIDQAVTDGEFPVTAFGGPGNDTFVALSPGSDQTTYFTGGAGHDLFHFSDQAFHGADNVTITDFGLHDAVMIDVNPSDQPAITFDDHGDTTTLNAVANGAQVHLTLAGNFDESQFHVADDGQGHAVITYGDSDWLVS